MKWINLGLGCVVFFFTVACVKETFSTSEQQRILPIIIGGEDNYLYDFPMYGEYAPGQKPERKTPRQFAISRSIDKANASELANLAGLVVTECREWLANSDRKNKGAFQGIAIRYLRRNYLSGRPLELTELPEIKVLLATALESESVDMDVLADAYLAVRDHSSAEELNAFRTGLQVAAERTLARTKVFNDEVNRRKRVADPDNELSIAGINSLHQHNLRVVAGYNHYIERVQQPEAAQR